MMLRNKADFLEYLNKAADLVFLSLLWLLGSLPVVTLGASFSALCHAVHRVIRLERGTAFAEFKKAYRAVLKPAVLYLLLSLAAALAVGLPLFLLAPFYSGQAVYQFYQVSGGFLFLFLLLLSLRFYALLGGSAAPLREGLANALPRSPAQLLAGLPVAALLALFLLFIIWYPPLVLILPSVFAWITVRWCVPKTETPPAEE